MLEELTERAIEIRDETLKNANSANRVGGLMQDIISYIDNNIIVPLSRTARVNYDLQDNVLSSLTFRTYAEALIWIHANGAPDASNQWQVILPGGTITEPIYAYAYIRVECNDSTIIDSLDSDVTYTNPTDLFKAYVGTCQINNLNLSAGKVLYLANSVIMDVSAATGTNYLALKDCSVFGGDFDNYSFPIGIFNTEFIGLSGISNVKDANCNYCTTNTDNFTGDIQFFHGSLKLLDSITGGIYFSALINSSDVTLTGDLLLSNVKAANPFTITIGAGNILTTENIDDNITVIEGGGTWINKGGKYDPSYTSLAATEFQGAIDKLWDYVNLSVTGLVDLKGAYNASTNTPDLDTAPSGILKGDMYIVTVVGEFFSEYVEVGDSLIAQQDNPTTVDHWIRVQKNILPEVVEVTYAQLMAMISSSELTPGQRYKMTDFKTVQNIVDFQTGAIFDTYTGTLEPLIVTAKSTNELEKEAVSTVYSNDKIYYSVDLVDATDKTYCDGAGVAVTGFKGMIYFRHDVFNNNSAPYDFREITFRRLSIDATTWIDIGFTQKYVVKSPIDGKIYKAITTHGATGIDPSVDNTNWILWLDITIDNILAWTTDVGSYGMNIGDVDTTNLIIGASHADYKTFLNYDYVKDTHIRSFYATWANTRVNNIVIKNGAYSGSCDNVEFTANSYAGTFINKLGTVTIYSAKSISLKKLVNCDGGIGGNTINDDVISVNFGYVLEKTIFQGVFNSSFQSYNNFNDIGVNIKSITFATQLIDIDVPATATLFPDGTFDKIVYRDKTDGIKIRYYNLGSTIIADVTD